MDWHLFHAVNVFAYRHDDFADAGLLVETWGVTIFACAVFGLWLLDRPGGPLRWRFAAAAGLASASLALAFNRAIGSIDRRARPYQAHAGVHVFVPRSHDPSFPSDHASAAFGIAWAILLCDRVAGTLFVAAAAAIAVGRVVVGVHYPSDILAGALVGLAAALLVVRVAGPVLRAAVLTVTRLTDPVLAPVWRLIPRRF